MANIYAANFGDVVKHAVLAEVLVREAPRSYLESHGGRLQYELAHIEAGPGGVWDFLAAARRFHSLDVSEYARVLRRCAGSPDRPGTYPGSIAFADALLAPGTPIVAFEIVEASASDLRGGLEARGRPAEIIVGDGLAGVCGRAQEGDLVLLDPFDVHARDGSLTAAEAFASLAARGVRALLWYAIYDADDTGEWIRATVSDLDVWSKRVVSDTSLGGLAGCGFLGANLAAPTIAAAAAIVDDLALALAPVRPGLGVR